MLRIPRIGAAIASTFVLLLPAIWNRFPLLQYDTGGYLVRWYEGYLVPSRSTVFGLFLNIFAHPDFWPVVVVQAALTVWVLALTLRALGFGGRRDEQGKAHALRQADGLTKNQEIKGEHGKAGEDVGEQDAGEPGQCGRDRQNGDQARHQERTVAQACFGDQQPEDPQGGGDLDQENGPEMGRSRGRQQEPIGARPARHQVPFEPARQVAAGVVLQEREAVPDRGREQDKGRRRPGGETQQHQHTKTDAPRSSAGHFGGHG